MKVKQLARTLSGIWFGTAHARGCDCDRHRPQRHSDDHHGDAVKVESNVSISSRSRFTCEEAPAVDVLNPN